ncbi:MarR family winged helix-turn-helix transcriptional regulator [Burkholderia sp. Z1]|uniref:MarR family winged helix-turn-helix transcriptional regulator n=1 Tax=Burkholderia sp. Z1 TaxID=2759039 RepID=UPI0018692B6A|nr:MarR family winged helix-turn-helix transcriptional regulator [Burkholderia sp. Z1]
MKQIERNGSPQRQICMLLASRGAMTINEIAETRGIHPRSTARQLDALTDAGFVSASGTPKRYTRTAKPIPAVVPLTPKAARIAERRRRDEERVAVPFHVPEPTELDRVMLSWVGVNA